MKSKLLIVFFLCLSFFVTRAQQTGSIGGVVTDSLHKPVPGATVMVKGSTHSAYTGKDGSYVLHRIPYGSHTIVAFALGMEIKQSDIKLNSEKIVLNFELGILQGQLQEITINSNEKTFGISRLKGVDGFAIYESKKNELIMLNEVNANLSTNNARQVFARVPGLNIWESDGAGLQMGIGGRGLSPNRTSNFNTRQNGYDISADALGYPESYYTPPMEALERIEVVRGASSLQYGTQFGGMLNFVFKKGPADKKIETNVRQTLGSWGLWNAFTSLGGTTCKNKLNYYTFFQHKEGNGWRPNSAFQTNTFFASANYRVNKHFSFATEYTYMGYVARQPGGLTDAQFDNDPQQSVRSRNWFHVQWNLFALVFEYKFSERTRINVRNFGLLAQRQALGNLERINVIDLGGNRSMIDGTYHNMGNETRLIHQYQLAGKNNTVLVGARFYKGTTTAKQGDASNKGDADFRFLNPGNLENSDYTYPNTNVAVFAENIFRLSTRFSITPGLRYEYIQTGSDGYYRYRLFDLAGNPIVDQRFYDKRRLGRSLVLAGIGSSYKFSPAAETYFNISQNYRAVNFSDLRITNPNMKVDSNIHDEKGFTCDIGFRGNKSGWFNYDISFFYLSYQDKIGLLLKADQPPLYLDYRYRTNIADARTYGLEAFAEANLWKLINRKTSHALTLFVNGSAINSRYVNSSDNTINNKKVELVPPVTLRSGSSMRWKKLQATAQVSYTAEQFSDATNAIRSSSAVNGIIRAYYVADLSFKYLLKQVTIEAGCNNFTDNRYFTRRADSYPGPGIIPADARSFYVTLALRF